MIEVLDSDYMLLAESKGISGPALIFRHALRNALIPIITVLAPLIVDLMTGSLVVEKIFAIPGVGSLLVTAIQSNDYNVVISLSFIHSADNGISRGFAAQVNRFFCHISRPPLPSGCAGR